MTNKTELICIRCPLGCNLSVTTSGGDFIVTGNTCPRGVDYAIKELTNPERIVTGSVAVTGGDFNTVSVKTLKPVPKGLMADVAAQLKGITLNAPVNIGDVVLFDVLGTGSDFVATRNVKAVK